MNGEKQNDNTYDLVNRRYDLMDIKHARLQYPGVLDRQQVSDVVDNMERGTACDIFLLQEVTTMPRVRAGYTGKYKLTKHEFYMAYHYALRYAEWKMEYDALADPSTGLRYDKDRVQTSGGYDTTEANGIRRSELRDKMERIEQTVIEADPDLYQYILMGVTNEDITYDVLMCKMHIPCARNTYYNRRRKFYWLLAQKI